MTRSLAHPRFWLSWIGVGLLRLLVLLPFSFQLALGRWLGRIVRRFARERRHVVERNLAICFPEQTATQRDVLLTQHFEALGISVFETGLGWFASRSRLARLTAIEGEEHLHRALAQGRGVILYTGHFTTLEVAGPALGALCPDLAAVYRPHRSPFLDHLFRSGRLNSAAEVIPKDSVRPMLRSLKRNRPLWYAPDQSYRRKQSAIVPFFGEPAMTNIATPQLAKISGAAVVPFFPERLPGSQGYRLVFGARVEPFPTEDAEADTRRLVALLEDHIRKCPEQYYWVHRKFKDRPPPLPDAYAN